MHLLRVCAILLTSQKKALHRDLRALKKYLLEIKG